MTTGRFAWGGVKLGFCVALVASLAVLPCLALVNAQILAKNVQGQLKTLGMLASSSVIEGVKEKYHPQTRYAFDATFDVVKYYFETYLNEAPTAIRYCSEDEAINSWSQGPKYAHFVSHGNVQQTTPIATPYLCVEESNDKAIFPWEIVNRIPQDAMEYTDVLFLDACYSLLNYPSTTPQRNFGRAFVVHCGADYVIGCCAPLHVLAGLLMSTYFWHFRLVYGYSTLSAFILAKAHTLTFLTLAAQYWPVSVPVAIYWLNQNLSVPLPDPVVALLMAVFFYFPASAYLAAYNTMMQVLIVDENYYED